MSVKAIFSGLLLILAALVLASCREDEQDRPLVYQKGEPFKAPGEALTEEQLEALRQRTSGQKSP